jgi:M6 family metalloprotease-like protein
MKNNWTTTFAAATVFAAVSFGQAPTDFGYQRLTVNGTPALGQRPLVVILMQYDGAVPAANLAQAPPLAHDKAYYDSLVFNPLATSVNGYYMENSHGRFLWTRAGQGTYGPYFVNGDEYDAETSTDKTLKRLYAALSRAYFDGLDFSQYDRNGDGVITSDELGVLVIDNVATTGAANRSPNPGCWVPFQQNYNVCLNRIANVGHEASLMSMAHELSHTLGTIDMYGSTGNENYEYTLLGATIFPTLDDRRKFHLDPWHKMMLGWIEPQIYSLETDGKAVIDVAPMVNGNQPVILYSPYKGTNEFYMLEFRSSSWAGGNSYDTNVNDAGISNPAQTGLVIWHIQTKGLGGENISADVNVIDAYDAPGAQMISVFMNGAPNFSRGSGNLWPAASVVPYSLQWLDGNGRAVQITIGKIANNGTTLPVSWGPPPAAPAPPANEKMFFYNQSSDSAATGQINDADASFTTLQSYGAGAFSPWTHVVAGGSQIFFYNASSGVAALGQLDGAGNFDQISSLRGFSTGWTNITYHKGYFFFYNAHNGVAAVGLFNNGVFQQYNSWTSFSPGWTHIVSTPKGLLFYNAANGSGAVGDWSYVTAGTGFGYISKVNFNQLSSFQAGSFSTGWTQIVSTSDGVLFYNAANGVQVMADVAASGGVTTRSRSLESLRTGWTSVAVQNDDILFYDAVSGDVAIGGIRKFSAGLEGVSEVNALQAGSLVIRQVYPGFFSTGWSQIVTVTIPPVIH